MADKTQKKNKKDKIQPLPKIAKQHLNIPLKSALKRD